jgi:uncharacterized protein Gcw-chp
MMKKFLLPAVMVLAASSAPAFAADLGAKMVTKAPVVVAPSPWEIAVGAGVASDYNFRGISQSANQWSVNSYFEARYNSSSSLQWYAGVGGYSIDFPNRASAEIDLYGGVRPTFDKLALDFGVWYYYYPGGQCFQAAAIDPSCNPPLPNGNVAKQNASFLEFYGKATYNFTDTFNVGIGAYYTDDWLHTGADGLYGNVTAKFTGPALANGWGWYISGEYGHYWLGTTDNFYGSVNFPAGTPLPDYSTWNVGLGLTWKTITIDLRYYDTDLSKSECNVLTGDHTATFSASNVTAINPGGLGSEWCSAAFVGKLSFDTTIK